MEGRFTRLGVSPPPSAFWAYAGAVAWQQTARDSEKAAGRRSLKLGLEKKEQQRQQQQVEQEEQGQPKEEEVERRWSRISRKITLH